MTSGAPRAQRRLHLAFAASLLLHAIILSVNFALPKYDAERDHDSKLEVVLVNARHARAPEKAEVLAQSNLDGGGNSEHKVRPKSPLPPQDTRRDGDALVEARKRAETPPPEPVRRNVLTAPKADTKIATAPSQPDPAPAEPERPTSGLDLLDSAVAIARMETEINRKLEEYATRPRKKFIGARAKEYRFAQYVEDWRQKIERVGTLNYPEAARGKLYGSLLLLVAIRADGSIERVAVQRSSGETVLDDAAKRIVELAAPFAPFPSDIRRDTDILEIARTWTFTNTDKMSAN
ncbi:TonB family protein [Aromatoleum sp.]|uniref:TonB family protein n=1 Tax=Aromatoleum sp. TaxID=2307007 RepID=UPI002FC9D28E